MTARFAPLIASLLVVSCGGTDSPTSPTPTPPAGGLTITCPTGVVATTTTTSVAVTFPTPTTTGGQAPVTVTCSPFSGSTFSLGTTTVACQATDARNTAAACTFPVVVSRIPTLTRTRFLAFGDSVTAGEVTIPISAGLMGEAPVWGPLRVVPETSYPTQLLTLLRGRYVSQSAFIQVTNAGKSGEGALEGAQRFPGVLTSSNANVVLLLEGYNDLGLYGSRGINVGVAGIDAMAKEARNRGARVFIASLTPSRPGGVNTLSPDWLVEYNSRLRTLAAGEGAVYVNLYDAMLPSLTTYIGVDGLHPTEAGYRRMADEFLIAIRSTLETP
jgi:lysophospholipase L1-like esterase